MTGGGQEPIPAPRPKRLARVDGGLKGGAGGGRGAGKGSEPEEGGREREKNDEETAPKIEKMANPGSAAPNYTPCLP